LLLQELQVNHNSEDPAADTHPVTFNYDRAVQNCAILEEVLASAEIQPWCPRFVRFVGVGVAATTRSPQLLVVEGSVSTLDRYLTDFHGSLALTDVGQLARSVLRTLISYQRPFYLAAFPDPVISAARFMLPESRVSTEPELKLALTPLLTMNRMMGFNHAEAPCLPGDAYQPPEHIVGESTQSTHVFSFGVLLSEMIYRGVMGGSMTNSNLPHFRAAMMQTVRKALHHMHSPLASFLERCCSNRPEDRPGLAGAMLQLQALKLDGVRCFPLLSYPMNCNCSA
jgi:serine/threonine protein kinase